ncbi:hypothetical protein EXIGLDRAFT_722432 [Exidia glandulosa HHB12029]|uniref:Uncharacterized protein n=1 Tax=Exidia glandulosa HHB12029 TaxID=1314781 RepID=A0A165FB68_EXIGL|nr:hypothetical protein EXIGLDRAFT_722432 [Exidia glandulosa HHB12029]
MFSSSPTLPAFGQQAHPAPELVPFTDDDRVVANPPPELLLAPKLSKHRPVPLPVIRERVKRQRTSMSVSILLHVAHRLRSMDPSAVASDREDAAPSHWTPCPVAAQIRASARHYPAYC